jgi:tungstate transport system substrate-binding protein
LRGGREPFKMRAMTLARVIIRRWIGGLCLLAAPLTAQGAPSRDIILATTTSTRDAGLLDALIPVFERRTGSRVKVIAVGSGQALELGRRGDADVVLAHAPDQERALTDSGYFVRRRLVMHNDFVILGPPDDPVRLRGMSDATTALQRIAGHEAPFISRGDRSGTHQLELKLWRAAGITPPGHGRWYVEAGHGMGETIQMADEKRAYTLADRATYLAWRDRLHLVPLVEGDPILFNVYHVLEPDPRNSTRMNAAGGRALADFFVDAETQRMIGEFGKDRFGQSLFVPDAGKPDPALRDPS